jgi:heat-inducible transcriptional repressor
VIVVELDERKRKILNAIIKTYLETGEPVGSRTISKYTDLNLSSATIRNEMSDLEDMGYILQPHTSAGRIPSDKGYRLYVNDMLKDKQTEVKEIKEKLLEKADKLEVILESAAKLLATDTNYTSMITKPQYKKHQVKFLQLSDLDTKKLLMVLVLDSNMVKNRIIDVPVELDKEMVLKLNIVLNTFLQGLGIEGINISVIQKLKAQAGEYKELVELILDEIANIIEEEDELHIITSGATNILKYPELSDKEKASEILYALEEKNTLTKLIADKVKADEGNEETGIQVYIGNESSIDSMKDCSLVTATYKLEDGVYGKVGIIGPKRMDYEKVVEALQNLKGQLDDIFKENN